MTSTTTSSSLEKLAVATGYGARETGFQLEQLNFLAKSAHTTPPAVALLSLMIVAIAWNHVPAYWSIAWFTLVTGLVLGRLYYVRRHLNFGSVNESDLRKANRTILAFSFGNGVAMALSSLLFFPSFQIEWQAVLTMLQTSLCAGAVPSSACRKRNFDLYALPILLALAVSWALWGKISPGYANFIIAVLLLLFLQVCSRFVAQSEAMFAESFQMRFENKQLVAQLQEQQRVLKIERDRSEAANNAKSRFLAAASHDLRQPLHTVSLYSAALSLRPLDERAQKLAVQISSGIASLASLLDSLLDISRLDSNSVEPHWESVDLQSLCQSVADEFNNRAAAQGVQLSCRISSGLTARTDGLWLKRVLRNLVDNALVHGARSSILITATFTQRDALLTVKDDGPGIPADEIEKIFEEFYQLHNPERDRSRGLGLGLSIVKRLSALLGIQYTVKSEAAVGTEFSLRIPQAHIDRRLSAELPVATTADERRVQGVRLLIVDDEQSVREGMAALASQWGCEFDLAADLEQAETLLTQTEYNGLIVDYRLRNHSRGIDLFIHPRVQGRGIARLVISGDSSAQVQREIAETGAELKLKPIDPQELWRFVKLCEQTSHGNVIPVAQH